MPVCSLSDLPGDRIDRSADICVVGAGPAGLVVARHLAGNGRSVILLESGPASCSEEDDPRRVRGLGGTSARWGGRILPLAAHDAGPRLGVPGWPFALDALDVYTPEVERILGLGHASFEEPPTDFPGTGLFASPAGSGLIGRWAKIVPFRRRNVFRALKTELSGLDGLSIVIDATAGTFRLDRERGRLDAIEARHEGGRTLVVRAKHFVLAAGPVETTRLLLLLDAASETHAFAGCRVLGRLLQKHLIADAGRLRRLDGDIAGRLAGYTLTPGGRRAIHFEMTKAAQRDDGVPSAYLTLRIDAAPGSSLDTLRRVGHGLQRRQWTVSRADLRRLAGDARLLLPMALRRRRHRQLFIPADAAIVAELRIEQQPRHVNRITLSPNRDPFGLPQARIDWNAGEEDERTFRRALARVSDHWRRAGYDLTCPIDPSEAARDPARSFVDGARDAYHPSGTTRMGLDRADSVVGPDLRCHCVPNVSVAGASTFPLAGSANPTFTVMQLAFRAANEILRHVP